MLMIWLDGKMVEKAEVNVFSHAVNYGSCVFETLRVYDTPKGLAFFRLQDHLRRFAKGAGSAGFVLPYEEREIASALRATVLANGLRNAYVRLNAFLACEQLRVYPKEKTLSLAITAAPLDYFAKPLGRGLTCCFSSWRKPPLDAMPSQLKFSANYLTSYLAVNEARAKGFDEALLLDDDGNVAEGSAQNVFVVNDGVVLTPPASGPILAGVTRASVMELAKHSKIMVEEKNISKDDVLNAEEVFLTGTAIEIMPVVRVEDKRFLVGETTRKLKNEFDSVLALKHVLSKKWLAFL